MRVDPLRGCGLSLGLFSELGRWVTSTQSLSIWDSAGNAVLIPCGCHSKVPQLGALKTDVDPLTVPEAGRQKPRRQQGWAPTEGSGEGPSCLFQLPGLQVFLGLWAHPPGLWPHLHVADVLCALL